MSKKARKNRVSARGQAAQNGPGALALVQRLDGRILAAATGAALDEGQKAEVLAWAHRDLMVPTMLRGMLGREPEALGEANKRWAWMSEMGARFVCLILDGKMRITSGFEFEPCGFFAEGVPWNGEMKANGENSRIPDCKQHAEGVVAWYHQRLAERVQESRPHSEEEVRALLARADAHMMLTTLIDFGMGESLGIDCPGSICDITIEAELLNLAVQNLVNIHSTRGGEPVLWKRKSTEG